MVRTTAAGVALVLACGCAGAELRVVKPSAIDPSLAELDADPARTWSWKAVELDRFDAFLGEAAAVEATMVLARRLGGELAGAVREIADARAVARVRHRTWVALARELSADADGLTPDQRDRLVSARRRVAPLVARLREATARADRLAAAGAGLIAQGAAGDDELDRLPAALDAVNVSVDRLHEIRARGPAVADELALGLEALAAIEGAEATAAGPAPASR